MNILLIGSGGRENAFAWKIAQSKKLNQLFIAPGNAGTIQYGINVDINVDDFEALCKFVYHNGIDIIIVGPEVPLVHGIYDYFKKDCKCCDIPVIGPEKAGAMLEGSKEFSKDFMKKYNIPTAQYKSITSKNLQEGIDFLKKLKAPYVLKASGLAAGKGVLIIDTLAEAEKTLKEMIGGMFGDASSTVVIEEYLDGIELSVFAITDGISYKILPEAKDYKRIGEKDAGLNTGGMGAVTPVHYATKEFLKKVEDRVIKPTFDGLKNEKITYKGFVYFGLMNVNGDPYVIEYNVRMGDPEAEVVIPRMNCDFGELLIAVAFNTLSEFEIPIDPRAVATVMLVSEGYPGKYQIGKEIAGLEQVEESIVFHAGTKHFNEMVLTNGGRVLSVTSYGKDLKEALATSYRSIEKINYEGKYFRRDIGFDVIGN